MPSKGDLKFARLVVESSFATKAQVRDALNEQIKYEKEGKITSLDRILVKNATLQPEQVLELARRQNRRIQFCPNCTAKLNVVNFESGTKVKCPECSGLVIVTDEIKFELFARKEPSAGKTVRIQKKEVKELSDTQKVDKEEEAFEEAKDSVPTMEEIEKTGESQLQEVKASQQSSSSDILNLVDEETGGEQPQEQPKEEIEKTSKVGKGIHVKRFEHLKEKMKKKDTK
jgi:Zn-finger nucleic acid-binding protein